MQYEYIYGKNTVKQVLLVKPTSVAAIYVLNNNNLDLQEIIKLAHSYNIAVQVTDNIQLNKLSGSDAHQGVVARAYKISVLHDEGFIRYKDIDNALLLALDNIQDPHNFGAIVRSAEAFGVKTIIVPERHHAPISPAMRKVACGAAERIDIVVVTNLVRTLEYLKTLNFWIIGADRAGIDVSQVKLPKMVLVMGAEGDGLRMLTRKTCDQLVGIHLRGTTESLNVSVATGILLYALGER